MLDGFCSRTVWFGLFGQLVQQHYRERPPDFPVPGGPVTTDAPAGPTNSRLPGVGSDAAVALARVGQAANTGEGAAELSGAGDDATISEVCSSFGNNAASAVWSNSSSVNFSVMSRRSRNKLRV